MAYLLDTNIFIQAKNDYYGFDLCPGFWAWLEQQNEANTVFTHEVFNPRQPGRRKIKIPAVCHTFEVPYIRIFEMLRKEGALFVLEAALKPERQ
ncbi:hypothetical protein XM38_043420 [Halomicronema hongdechloris C2206]|uniref:DUF4411 family protein n=1 Tax=Halomicronema hongdechloris C2206 TaxID=1641165 RepID=A0A1Z3HTD3_9CYAN|nr:DUF4411 family protein [Halomicronema hongdechloris]ASC73377.1 hypothetical protein XM38_043420 [Halomicronema hongdechloris C2206]